MGIKKLDINEERLRDIYLRKLALGEIQGPLTGKASIDRPWLKHYAELPDYKQNERTVYQELIEKNRSRKDQLALEYFGTKTSFGELFKKIDATAKAYYANGVREGDFVTICTAGIPETVYSFYALSKIGAVSNMIAPHFDHEQLVKRIEDCDSDVLVVMDTFYDDIKEAISKSRIKKTIVIPSLNASLLGLISKKHKIDRNANEVYWNEFIKEGKYIDNVPTCEHKEEQPVAMVYSSGTTGASKGILLTNDSFQNSVSAYDKMGFDLRAGQKLYQIVPPWFSTGLSTSIHLPLSKGISVYMDPRFDRKNFVKNIVKAKTNYTVAPTSMYEGFLDKKLVKNRDLSHLTYPFEGGETLSTEVRTAVEEVFHNHGSSAELKVGYGQCEGGAGITTEIHNYEHPEGTVGIPLAGVVIGIFDEDRNELTYGNRGEVLASTPCRMKEYYKNEEATNEYFYIDENGRKWNCTGDIGYIDEDGYLYIEGRASDYSMVGDKKVYNFDIENTIKNVEGIINVDVLEKRDEQSENKIAIHIIPTHEFMMAINDNPELLDDKLSELQTLIFEKFQDQSLVPTIFKLRESFPHAKSGKRDTVSMMNETEGFINYPFEIKKGAKVKQQTIGQKNKKEKNVV